MKFELTTRIDEAGNDVPCFAFDYKDFMIHDPTESECGRFTVDPATYGVSPDEARALRIANKALADDFYKDAIR